MLLCDTNTVYNMDFGDMYDYHTKTGADITVLGCSGKLPALANIMALRCDDGGRVQSVAIAPKTDSESLYSVNTMLMRKSLLVHLVRDAETYGYESFEKDIIQKSADKLNIRCYAPEGFCRTVDSLVSYYNVNMMLLDGKIRSELFAKDRPVYTKIRNDMPVLYGLCSKVSNSLISDGCVIEGTVENSVLARGVRVAAGAVVRDSILMQDTYVGEDASLQCVITDKSAVITPYKRLSGASSFPVYVGKGIMV